MVMAFHPEATGGGLWLIVGSPTLELGNDLTQGSRVNVPVCTYLLGSVVRQEDSRHGSRKLGINRINASKPDITSALVFCLTNPVKARSTHRQISSIRRVSVAVRQHSDTFRNQIGQTKTSGVFSVPEGSTLSHEIAEILRGEILDQRYREGDRLPSEGQWPLDLMPVAARSGEAFSQLEQLGIIAVLPGGARVRALNSASISVLGP